MYNDDYKQYKARISPKISQLSRYTPSTQDVLGGIGESPMGLAIGHGYKNLLAHSKVEDLYLRLSDGLKQVFPTNYIYPLQNLHISNCVLNRTNKKPGHVLYDSLPKGYAETTTKKVMNTVGFSEFTLRLIHIFPRGIMLWEPYANHNEIFNIRRQISNNLQSIDPDGGFTYDSVDNVPVVPDIIHTSYSRVLNPAEWVNNFDQAHSLFNDVNDKIAQREYTITIRNVSFVKTLYKTDLPLTDEYNITKLFEIEHVSDVDASA